MHTSLGAHFSNARLPFAVLALRGSSTAMAALLSTSLLLRPSQATASASKRAVQ
jgi:hypothetical protein